MNMSSHIVRRCHDAERADDEKYCEPKNYFSHRAADQLLNRTRAKVGSSTPRQPRQKILPVNPGQKQHDSKQHYFEEQQAAVARIDHILYPSKQKCAVDGSADQQNSDRENAEGGKAARCGSSREHPSLLGEASQRDEQQSERDQRPEP